METATIFNCTTIWTNDTLIDLGERVADDGFGPWEASIAELVAAARARHIALVMADVLGNLTVPAPVRARAFARVVSAMVTSALPESMRRGVDARGHRTSGVLLDGVVAQRRPMTSLRPAALLIAWSLLVWTTRISNIVADESLDSTGRLWRIVLALSFTVFALGAIQVTWRMRVRPAPEVRRRWSRWMRAFAIWTVLVWTIRGTGIFIGDHPVGFVVVHTVLALVSFVVSAATWRSTAAQSPVAAVSV